MDASESEDGEFADKPRGADWLLRGLEPEQKFASDPLSDDCIDAAKRAQTHCDPTYPGWQIYSRVVRGEKLFDRQIAAWAIWMARLWSRCRVFRQRRRVCVVRRSARENAWIARAGLDAVYFVIHGYYPVGLGSDAVSAQLGVDNELYKRFRDDLLKLMLAGFNNYVAELHLQLRYVEQENREYKNNFRLITAF